MRLHRSHCLYLDIHYCRVVAFRGRAQADCPLHSKRATAKLAGSPREKVVQPYGSLGEVEVRRHHTYRHWHEPHPPSTVTLATRYVSRFCVFTRNADKTNARGVHAIARYPSTTTKTSDENDVHGDDRPGSRTRTDGSSCPGRPRQQEQQFRVNGSPLRAASSIEPVENTPHN